MKIIGVCLVLFTICYAEENKTAKISNNLSELDQQLKFQKREKQYLIEDDPSERPEQRREERQSSTQKNSQIEPNISPKPMKVRLQPKILPNPIKQGLKPIGLTKPINGHIDNKPQKIPTKLPVVRKNSKVVPSPAHVLRMKKKENEINNTVNNNKETEEHLNKNKINPSDINTTTTENNATPQTKSRSGQNKVHKVITSHDDDVKETINQDDNLTINKDGKDKLNKDARKKIHKDNQETLNNDIPTNVLDESGTTSKTVQKPIHFFEDETESLPPSKKHRHKSHKEEVSTKSKEIPLVRKVNKKLKKHKSIKEEHETNNETQDESDIIRISNGTHIISIKKITNQDDLLSDNVFDDEPDIQRRIMNGSPIQAYPVEEKPKHKPKKKENIKSGNKYRYQNNKEDEDPNDCITITNHNYEEFEEKTPISPPTPTQPDIKQETWNYLQTPQNYYYDPYYQNIMDQYKTNYGLQPTNLNIYGQTSTEPAYKPEDSQIYFPNDNQPVRYDLNQYQYVNYPSHNSQPEIDYTLCQELRPENTLDRIWRTWKDFEIKIRNSQLNDNAAAIDIRRDFELNDGNHRIENGIANYASLPVSFNGYYNHNSALIHPYVNPNFRLMR